MTVLIGVDPHKATLAVAAIDEATGSSSSVLPLRRTAPA
jgi:hypothetical protein